MVQLRRAVALLLIEAIELAAQEAGQNILSSTQQVEKAKRKIKAVKTEYEQLKEDYEKFLEKCMCCY